VFLKVELLSGVQLLGAPCHDLTVSGNDIGLIEVVGVVSQRSVVEFGVLWVELESKMLKARVLNDVKLDQMRGKLSNSGSYLIKRVVGERSAELFWECSQNHPVLSSEAWRRLSWSSLLRSSISVNIETLLLKIGSTRNDKISIICSLITRVPLIDNEGILWDLFVSKVVSTKKVNNLRLMSWACLGSNTEVESTNSASFVMKDINTVPLFFLVDEVSCLSKLVNLVHDGSTVSSFENSWADQDHRKLSLG
jgi:hypothetical protein